MKCDRCGIIHGVEMLNDCPECGPVPLCYECLEVHRGEVEYEKMHEEGTRDTLF